VAVGGVAVGRRAAAASRRASGAGEKEAERREESGSRFKSLIFGGQGTATQNKKLFSVDVSDAAENNLIFGGCVRGHRKLAYFWRPSYTVENINLFSAARPWPPKIIVAAKNRAQCCCGGLDSLGAPSVYPIDS
jgi:hypothetical protein